MKVMMFTGAVPELRSGVGDYVHEVYRSLEGKLDLVVVTTNDSEVKPDYFPKAKVLCIAKSWGLSDLGAIEASIKAEKPDIFHQQYPSLMGGPSNRAPLSNILPLWLKWRFRSVPIVTTMHEFGERRVRWRARAIANVFLSDALITITSKDMLILKRWKANVRRVPLVSNIPSVPRPGRGGRRRAIVSFFGLLDPLKGFERFIEVACLLGKDAFEFAIIGGFDPDRNEYHASLRRTLEGKGMASAFRFLGHIPRSEVAVRLAESDCCLLPFEEGVSERRTSLLAALMQGTPVVTTDGPYVPDDFRGIPGLALARPEDAAGMAAKVRELCSRGARPEEFASLVSGISHAALGEGHLQAYGSALAGRNRT